MKYTNAPIVIFAFNRLLPLKATINSLRKNTESKDSDLYIFVDGARKNKEGEADKVRAVQDYVKGVTGFKSIQYVFSTKNKGLGPSIISGVTDIINMYGKAIVLEDDLILSRNFLSFMNQGLDLYESNKEVFSICGYNNKVRVPQSYTFDSYFCVRSSSSGWATWSDRWNSVDWVLNDWEKCEKFEAAFNQWGGSDCFSMLRGWKYGRNKSWAIRFCFSQFRQNKISLFPIISKVDNNGFDGDGTNCKKYSRFKIIFDTTERKTFSFPDNMVVNEALKRSALSYHSVWRRIFSKIMYIIYK